MIRKDGKIECKFSKKFLADRSLSLTTAGIELAQAPLFKFNRYKRRINVKLSNALRDIGCRSLSARKIESLLKGKGTKEIWKNRSNKILWIVYREKRWKERSKFVYFRIVV